ncbi:MAG: hypothetical protein JWO40_552 [Candidatus Doudnabacteria bacterium]|nr:hypothetical protein [Candidatus Doudnabacteria bacterium]
MGHRHDDHGKAVGLGILGFALGAIAGIFLAPKSGKRNREDLKNWTSEMSDEINTRVRDAKDMTVDKYNSTVDDVAEKYKKLHEIKDSELEDFVSDLKQRWNRIRDQWNDDKR